MTETQEAALAKLVARDEQYRAENERLRAANAHLKRVLGQQKEKAEAVARFACEIRDNPNPGEMQVFRWLARAADYVARGNEMLHSNERLRNENQHLREEGAMWQESAGQHYVRAEQLEDALEKMERERDEARAEARAEVERAEK